MPEKIGRFEIVGKIGQGGFGAVYQGRDPSINRLAAIKVVNEAVAAQAHQIDRFKREAAAAGGLNHRNIVTIYELGEHEGRPYIAMEYLPGRDVASVISKKIALPMESRLDLIAQIAEGLQFAHEHDIIHRDIKPANIRILEDGTAKIMDFGIARMSGSQMTRTGHIMGTVNYMAPEQLQGKDVDGRADQFSLGVTAYELLSMRRPFPGDNISAVLYHIVHEQPQNLHELQATPHEWIDRVIMRCLEKDPSKRWPSCEALAEALRGGLALDPTSMSMPAAHESDGLPTQYVPSVDLSSSSVPVPQSAHVAPAVGVQTPPPGTPPGPYTPPPGHSLPPGQAPPGHYTPSGQVPPYTPSVQMPAAYTPSAGMVPGAPPPTSSARGVLIGVVATIAVAATGFVGYSVSQGQGGGAPEPRAAVPVATAEPAPPPIEPAPETVADPVAGDDLRLGELKAAIASARAAGDPAAARTALAEALALAPDDDELAASGGELADLEASIAAAARGDAAAAADKQRQADHAALVEGKAQRARRLEKKGDVAGALAAWREVVRLDSRWPGARQSVAKLESRLADANTSEAVTQLRAALVAERLDTKRIEQRRAKLRKLDPSHPLVAETGKVVAGVERARAAIAAQDPDGAEDALAGLDEALPAVARARADSAALAARRRTASADLKAARNALAGGRRDEAVRLATKARTGWAATAADAEEVIAEAQAPTPAPTKVASSAAAERPRIEALLARYAAAIDGADIGALKALWPTIPGSTVKTIERSFGFARSHEVKLDIVDLELTGDRATVTCRRRDRIETNDGQVANNESRAVFDLEKAAGSWQISKLR